jgi:hypothetical protein
MELSNVSESEGAVIARYYRENEGRKVRLEPVVPRNEMPQLYVCAKHPRLVYWADGECPCCELMREMGITEPPESLR